MDSYLLSEILKSLGSGDLRGFAAYAGIFFMLWIEVRGLKKEMRKMNESITTGFTAGEARFGSLEKHQQDFEHRLTVLEEMNKA